MSSPRSTIKTFETWQDLLIAKQFLMSNGVLSYPLDENLGNSSLPAGLEGYRLQVSDEDREVAMSILGRRQSESDRPFVPNAKPLVRFLTSVLLIVGIAAVTRQSHFIYADYSNLTGIDKILAVFDLVSGCIFLIACGGMYRKKKWGWLFVSAFWLTQIINGFVIGFSALVAKTSVFFLVALFSLCVAILLLFYLQLIMRYFNFRKIFMAIAGSVTIGCICAVPQLVPRELNQVSLSYLYLKETKNLLYHDDAVYTGQLVDRHRNGQIKTMGFVKDGFPEGKWLDFYADGKPRSSRYFHNHSLQGDHREWFANGNIQSVQSLNQGHLDGVSIEYYQNGFKKTEQEFKDDNKNGRYGSWLEDGSVEESGYYLDGKKDGVWIRWAGGNKIREENYRSGKRDGMITYWTVDGKKTDEGYFQNDLMTGTWTEWNEDGEKMSEKIFSAGVLVDEKNKPL